MPTVTFYNQAEIADGLLKFAVIAAKYDGKWIFCRHKQRATWEIPGGHREQTAGGGREDILDTAKRELYEETGAAEFEIRPVCVYGVTKEDETTFGLLCFAEVTVLGKLPPEMEIGEIHLFNALPENLTYPAIQPELYTYIQGWLNLQSSPDELWDVYDENRQLTGRTHRRGDKMPEGDYHLVVHVWLQNRSGEFLLTKRTPNKGFPNLWECSGGSAVVGDDSLTAAIREVKEETGITLIPENGSCMMTKKGSDHFSDIWLFKQDFNNKDVVFQEKETCGARSATKEQILKMRSDGTLVPFSYLDEFFEKVRGL